MACEGWDDGELCMLEVNISGKTIDLKGVVIGRDSENHKLLIEYNLANSTMAVMALLEKSADNESAFWVNAHEVKIITEESEGEVDTDSE